MEENCLRGCTAVPASAASGNCGTGFATGRLCERRRRTAPDAVGAGRRAFVAQRSRGPAGTADHGGDRSRGRLDGSRIERCPPGGIQGSVAWFADSEDRDGRNCLPGGGELCPRSLKRCKKLAPRAAANREQSQITSSVTAQALHRTGKP